MKKWRQTVCGCVCSGGTGGGLKQDNELSVVLNTCMQRVKSRRKKDIRNGCLVLYFVEALGNKSVNWPLPVLAPPSQWIVAACLRHGSHCQRLTATSLLFPCSGWRATHYHPHYSTGQQRGEDSSRSVCKELQVSLYANDVQWRCFVCLFLFGPSHIRGAGIKYQISRVGVLL